METLNNTKRLENISGKPSKSKTFRFIKGFFVILSVYILMIIFFSIVLKEKRIIKGTEYIKRPSFEDVFIDAIPTTIVIVFLYKKIAKKFNL